jgi:hypothetical protein
MKFNTSKWASDRSQKSNGLHPELVKLGQELGIVPERAAGANQAYFGDVWVGYYAGYGKSPWQVGPSRRCMSRAQLVALLTTGEEPEVTYASAPTRKDIAAAMEDEGEKAEVKAEVAVQAPVKAQTSALVKALIVSEDDEIAALMAKIDEIKARKADKAAKIAALKAELEALSADE